MCINIFGLPQWLRQEIICLQCRRPRFDSWVGETPGKGNGYPLQYSSLKNHMDKEPGGLQPRGLQIVRHNWVTNTFTFVYNLSSAIFLNMKKKFKLGSNAPWVACFYKQGFIGTGLNQDEVSETQSCKYRVTSWL